MKLVKTLKKLILAPKMIHLSHFDHNASFLLKFKAATFTDSHQEQFQKNLMRFREKLQQCWFWAQILYITLIFCTKKICYFYFFFLYTKKICYFFKSEDTSSLMKLQLQPMFTCKNILRKPKLYVAVSHAFSTVTAWV